MHVHMIFSDVTLFCMGNVLSVHLQPSAVNGLLFTAVRSFQIPTSYTYVCTHTLCVCDTEDGKYVSESVGQAH